MFQFLAPHLREILEKLPSTGKKYVSGSISR